MKRVIYFIIITVIISCNSTNRQDIKSYYYPDKNSFDTINLINLDLNGFVDYAGLFLEVDSLACKRKNFNIRMHDENYIYNLQPIGTCLMDDGPPLEIKMRNILCIKDDSIIRPTRKYGISEMSTFLNKFYNNKSDNNFPIISKKGVLIISFETNTEIGKIKSTLKDIFDNYNKVNLNRNDSLQLNIMFVENSEIRYIY